MKPSPFNQARGDNSFLCFLEKVLDSSFVVEARFRVAGASSQTTKVPFFGSSAVAGVPDATGDAGQPLDLISVLPGPTCAPSIH